MSDRVTILMGDALEQLRTLPGESVQCCVTSPPYWGLRDYGVEGQIGLEATPEEFIGKLVAVFREVRRVLRKDGTCWVNMGDCYASASSGAAQSGMKALSDKHSPRKRPRENHALQDEGGVYQKRDTPAGYKEKDLVGQPWMLAFALRADGWYLRRDIIWSKPNPMPESVKDRPVTAHEYLFLLTKSKSYYYDGEAIMERVTGGAHARGAGVNPKCVGGWESGPGSHKAIDFQKEGTACKAKRTRQNASFSAAVCDVLESGTRQRRSVWTIPPAPFKEAHFATFPPDLVKPCVLAGTSEAGACAACGAPRVRTVEKGEPDLAHQQACGGDGNGAYDGKATKDFAAAGAQDASAVKARILAGMRKRKTTGWEASCECGDRGTVPCVVLDPFGGSGTTGMVAVELGRRAVLIELNPAYVPLIRKRVRVTPGLAFGGNIEHEEGGSDV